ncbi:hypothetical protein DFH08DRAFT_989164 [Mycena albidolilacea]|uniref:Uncharacterized protein n=1 Tax=Mycena albidolilacea TaxID=1033008 RepID=A0AAD7E938_9AGAR|nr:hypothetical protein DFH08DRAFT_989164 [Mycena albidolilacea]
MLRASPRGGRRPTTLRQRARGREGEERASTHESCTVITSPHSPRVTLAIVLSDRDDTIERKHYTIVLADPINTWPNVGVIPSRRSRGGPGNRTPSPREWQLPERIHSPQRLLFLSFYLGHMERSPDKILRSLKMYKRRCKTGQDKTHNSMIYVSGGNRTPSPRECVFQSNGNNGARRLPSTEASTHDFVHQPYAIMLDDQSMQWMDRMESDSLQWGISLATIRGPRDLYVLKKQYAISCGCDGQIELDYYLLAASSCERKTFAQKKEKDFEYTPVMPLEGIDPSSPHRS